LDKQPKVRSKKVLIVATTFPRHKGDDQPRFVADLCASIPDGYRQRVLVPSADPRPSNDIVEGVEVKRFRYFPRRGETLAYGSGILGNLKAKPLRWLLVPFFLVGLAIALRRELRQFQPDIIHAHWWFPAGLVAALLLTIGNRSCKLLTTCHGADYYVLGERFPKLRHWVFERSDRVALVSKAMRNHAARKGLPKEKLTVAPMGVDLTTNFRPAEYEIKRKGVLYVGRLVEKKGVDTLLAGWAAAPQEVRDHGLTVIGSGNMKDSLLALTESLGIEDSVNFAGSVPHSSLPAYFQQARLLVFPSLISTDNDQEGLGLVAIEAMGCDCPVLASDVASLSDVILDGETGFVFPMGDSASLAQRLAELLSSATLCNAIGKRGGNFVRSRFDWSSVGERYGSLYSEMTLPAQDHLER
jgi:glycosyltransferase involved in cell wall biosynthesis